MLTGLSALARQWAASAVFLWGPPGPSGPADPGFLSANREKIFYTLTAGNLLMLPFAVNHFLQGRHLLGVATTAMTACFAINAVAVYRGKTPPVPLVLVLLP